MFITMSCFRRLIHATRKTTFNMELPGAQCPCCQKSLIRFQLSTSIEFPSVANQQKFHSRIKRYPLPMCLTSRRKSVKGQGLPKRVSRESSNTEILFMSVPCQYLLQKYIYFERLPLHHRLLNLANLKKYWTKECNKYTPSNPKSMPHTDHLSRVPLH